ncbi:hypothetical protein L1987_58186 [Smallanthus sonchifolius]|uniref:Uncharacterized protein n=1 Tax=Smallanthus sonchifolius TaxID=185202 RepID=A0ACB9DEM0_9ASTR|nr:hypothetical protein L1987_58186 [Smallanthus sonchifolius]
MGLGVAFEKYDRLRHTIDWQDVKVAPDSRWMWMPYTGLLIAQRFGMIVHLLSIAGNQTFFPLWFGSHVHAQHQIVSFIHVNNAHFIHVKLDGDFLMPAPNAFWILHRNDVAAEWENTYSDRIERFKKIMATDPQNYTQVDAYCLVCPETYLRMAWLSGNTLYAMYKAICGV